MFLSLLLGFLSLTCNLLPEGLGPGAMPGRCMVLHGAVEYEARFGVPPCAHILGEPWKRLGLVMPAWGAQ